jgi:hypothetical protein
VSETSWFGVSVSKLFAALKTAGYFVALMLAAPFIAAYFALSLLWHRIYHRQKALPPEITAELANEARSLAQFPRAETTATDILEQISAARANALPQAGVLAALRQTIGELCEAELPTVPAPPDSSDPAASAAYRDTLRRHVEKASDASYLAAVTGVLIFVGLGLIDTLPPAARQGPSELAGHDGEQRLPLIDILPDPVGAIDAVLSPFYADGAERCFSALKLVLRANLEGAGQVQPREFGGNRRELVETYLKRTPLAALFEVEIPIVIPKAA